MAGVLDGECSYSGSGVSSHSRNSHKKQEEVSRLYFGRREIENNSPSRLDGIDLQKETYLRKSYCTFLQDLGLEIESTIATVCMVLAGKVEKTPRPLKDVINVSYKIINEKDPGASQKIEQKEVYEQQKVLILNGGKIVLSTLAFGLNVYHPYIPLGKAIKIQGCTECSSSSCMEFSCPSCM